MQAGLLLLHPMECLSGCQMVQSPSHMLSRPCSLPGKACCVQPCPWACFSPCSAAVQMRQALQIDPQLGGPRDLHRTSPGLGGLYDPSNLGL